MWYVETDVSGTRLSFLNARLKRRLIIAGAAVLGAVVLVAIALIRMLVGERRLARRAAGDVAARTSDVTPLGATAA